MDHDITLNIHYTAPEEIWKKIGEVYKSMPYWAEDESYPHWIGSNINIDASLEPGGIQIAGNMPDDIWEKWYTLLKQKLTDVLGYDIGEPEDGFEFRYYD